MAIKQRQYSFYNAKDNDITNGNATGDPTGDDTTALKNLIAGVESGSSIYLPAGTYNLTDTLTVTKNIRIYGDVTAPDGHRT